MPEDELLPHSIYAQRVKSCGLLAIPLRKNKRPLEDGFPLLKLKDLDEEYFKKFENPKTPNFGIACGAQSENLELLDIDSKYDLNRGLEGDIFETIKDNIIEYSHSLWSKLVVLSTPSGGKHILYRCNVIGKNVKYAMRPMTDQELSEKDIANGTVAKKNYMVLAEAKSTGGYMQTWPTPGYEFIQGDFSSIPKISEEDREAIILAARSVDQRPSENAEAGKKQVLPANLNRKGKYQITPWDDYNEREDVLDVLISNGWTVVRQQRDSKQQLLTYLKRPGKSDADHSAVWNYVPNRLWCYSTSTPFPNEKPIFPFDIYKHYEANGLTKLATEKLFQAGYGRTFDPAEIRESASRLQQSASNTPVQLATDMPFQGQSLCTWWSTTLKQNKEGDWKVSLTLNKHRFYKWMSEKGFRRLKRGDTSYEILLIEGCVIRRIMKEEILSWVIAWIEGLPDNFDYITPEILSNAAFDQAEKFLHDYRVAQIKDFNKDELLKDDKLNSYIPFNNGVVRVGIDKVELIPYKKLHKLVWKERIKTVDFHQALDDDIANHDFTWFLYEIAGSDKERLKNLMMLIGYLLSNWKDPSYPKAVIFCDSKVSDRSEGGTGKGILVKAMSHLRSVVIEDGRQINRKVNSEFRFGRITEHTEIYNLSDVEKGFDFEAMFTLLTEGIPIRRLFKDEVFIPYEDSPKVVISTNFTVAGRGSSHDRRKVEFELSDVFSATYTPMDRFQGRAFFDSWDLGQWTGFYGVMIKCLSLYIKHGTPKFEGKNIELRKFIDESSTEFTNWFFELYGTKEEVMAGGGIKDPRYATKSFTELYQEFLNFAGLERHEARPKKFKQMLDSGCKYVGLELKEENMKGKSGSMERFLLFSDPKKKISKYKPEPIKTLSLDTDDATKDAYEHQQELGFSDSDE